MIFCLSFGHVDFFGIFKGSLEWEEKRSTCGNRAIPTPVPALSSRQVPLPLQGGKKNPVKLTEESTRNAVKWDVDYVDFLGFLIFFLLWEGKSSTF
jgi:hypothetical protein